MQFQNLYTKQSLTTFLSQLTRYAQQIPGIKLKSTQLLKAAALVEGYQCFEAMEPTLVDIETPFTFTSKRVDFKYTQRGGFYLHSVEVLIKPQGYWSSPVKLIQSISFEQRSLGFVAPSISAGGEANDNNTTIQKRALCLRLAIDEAYSISSLLCKADSQPQKAVLYFDPSWEVRLLIDDDKPTKQEAKHFFQRQGTLIAARNQPLFIVGEGVAVEPKTLVTHQNVPFFTLHPVDNKEELEKLMREHDINLSALNKISTIKRKGQKYCLETNSMNKPIPWDYGRGWPVGSEITINGKLYSIDSQEGAFTVVIDEWGRSDVFKLYDLAKRGDDVLLINLPQNPIIFED